jgi:hypothetical protein
VATSPAVPFKRSSIPELRRVSVFLHDDVAGMLTYFDNIHRQGQLEKLEIRGYVDVNDNGNLPRLADLRQWLRMSTSTEFTFEMELSLISDDDQHLEALLTEYRRVTGEGQTKYERRLHLLYPATSFPRPVGWNNENCSDEAMDEGVDYLMIDVRINEVRRRISISHIICFDVHSSIF